MTGQTEANIAAKRRIRRRYRRLQFFRLLIFLSFLGGIGWGGYRVFLWGGEVYHHYYGVYQAYIARKASHQTAMDAQFDNYMNVLLLGVDEGEEDGAPNADSVLLVSLDQGAGRVRVLSIPRGTLMTAADGTSETISRIYRMGGPTEAMRAVRDLLGVTLHYYVVLDPKILAELVDAVGGIDLYAEMPMDYEDPDAHLAIHIAQGYQHMDGDTVQKYLRYRSGELGDIGRVQRQRRFVKAMYDRLLQLDTVPKLPQLAQILQARVTTSVEVWDSGQLAAVVQTLSPEPPDTAMLPGAPQVGDDSVYVADLPKVKEKIAELFPEPVAGEESKDGAKP